MEINTTARFEPFLSILKIAVLWSLAIGGYYFVLPKFGLSLSYNSDPFYISLYFSVWLIFAVWYFRNILGRWIGGHSQIWLNILYSLGGAVALCGLVYLLSLLPLLQGPLRAPYTDLLFATPWYFLPKSIEILIQQLLITVLVAVLFFKYNSLKKVIIGYIVCFGGAHIILFLFSGASTAYAIIMTVGAFLTAFVFPYLLLKIRGGFVYAYLIHFSFYVVLAFLIHAWPPPGYFA